MNRGFRGGRHGRQRLSLLRRIFGGGTREPSWLESAATAFAAAARAAHTDVAFATPAIAATAIDLLTVDSLYNPELLGMPCISAVGKHLG